MSSLFSSIDMTPSSLPTSLPTPTTPLPPYEANNSQNSQNASQLECTQQMYSQLADSQDAGSQGAGFDEEITRFGVGVSDDVSKSMPPPPSPPSPGESSFRTLRASPRSISSLRNLNQLI